MISFNCIGTISNTWEILETLSTWGVDDKIITRESVLKFATFDGDNFVGGLVNHNQLSMSLGYKVYYSGAPGAVLEQTGLPQLPVQHVTLSEGWNWIGHAPLRIVPLIEIAAVAGNFSADDQVKTRAGTTLTLSTFDGDIWDGSLLQLTPGLGYEFKVQAQITFSYGG